MESFSTSAGPRARLALFALSSLITALDFTIVYVALPDIGSEVGFSPHALQWVVSAYAIAFGGLLLLAGRLSDLVGRRRVFLTGMALFALGSLLGGLATAPGLLIGARVVQGLGAAAVFPSTLALVQTTFAEGRQRDRAVGIWAAAGAAGLSLGALLGGVLTEAVGWRGVFFVNLPLTVVGVIGAVALLAGDPPRQGGRDFDLPGALTGTAGASLLVFATAQGSELGWTSPAVAVAVLAAVALIAAFIGIEASTHRPLLPLRLFRNTNLSAALGVILVFGMTLNSIPYALTQYFQAVLGLTALQAGLGFLVPTATITAGNLLGEPLVARFGVRAVLFGGLSVGAVGAALLTPAMTADGTYLAVLPGLVGFGLGLGVVFPAMFSAASTDVPERDSGIASGLASTALQIGTAAGLAVLVGIATANVGDDASPTVIADGLQTGLYVIAAGALVAIPAALALPNRRDVATTATKPTRGQRIRHELPRSEPFPPPELDR
jgi:EmrB/QacA subfamily drug resistance transporter